MKERPPPTDEPLDAGHYEIRFRGRLHERWSTWFGGLTVGHDNDGSTVISGRVADQAALHGLLQRVRDLGLPLMSVTRLEPNQSDRAGNEAGMDTDDEGRSTP